MSEDAFSFEAPLEWRLAGTPDMVSAALRRAAEEFRLGGYVLRAEERKNRSGLPIVMIRAEAAAGSGAIGIINVDGLPGNRTRMSIPARPAGTSSAWSPDQDGWLFSAYLRTALSQLRHLGFLANSSRFESYGVLQTARRELDAAEDSTAFANIGNSCRAALKALANELYAQHMLPDGQEEPKGADAKTKLKHVCNHYFAGRGENYRKGLAKVVEGVWDMTAALTHRQQSATREEGEAILTLVAALFEAFSFVIPS